MVGLRENSTRNYLVEYLWSNRSLLGFTDKIISIFLDKCHGIGKQIVDESTFSRSSGPRNTDESVFGRMSR